MSKVSVKGIIVGGITDVVLSGVLGIPLVAYVMASRGLTHDPGASSAVLAAIHGSFLLYSIQISTGLGCSVLGGYISARIAKHNELLNGTLASIACLLVGVWSLATGKVSASLLEQLALMATAPLCSFVGGYLRSKQVAHASQA